ISCNAAVSLLVRVVYFPGRIALTARVPRASLRSVSSDPSNASSPLPSPLCLFTLYPSCGPATQRSRLCEDFIGRREVRLGAFRSQVPDHRWRAEARRLGQTDVARHERAIHLVAE